MSNASAGEGTPTCELCGAQPLHFVRVRTSDGVRCFDAYACQRNIDARKPAAPLSSPSLPPETPRGFWDGINAARLDVLANRLDRIADGRLDRDGQSLRVEARYLRVLADLSRAEPSSPSLSESAEPAELAKLIDAAATYHEAMAIDHRASAKDLTNRADPEGHRTYHLRGAERHERNAALLRSLSSDLRSPQEPAGQ